MIDAPEGRSHPTDLAALRTRYLAAQLRGDRREALRVVLEEGLGSGASVAQIRSDLVRGAQAEIGRLWEENRISIAQEHMASAISQVVLAHLYDRADRSPDVGKRVLVACVEGELHDLPARIAADTLDLAGFDVIYLGASVPTDSLVATIEAERPDLLALSCTISLNVPALREAVARVRTATGGRLPIVVGGNAVAWSPGLPAELGVDGVGASGEELVDAARSILASQPPQPPEPR